MKSKERQKREAYGPSSFRYYLKLLQVTVKFACYVTRVSKWQNIRDNRKISDFRDLITVSAIASRARL